MAEQIPIMDAIAQLEKQGAPPDAVQEYVRSRGFDMQPAEPRPLAQQGLMGLQKAFGVKQPQPWYLDPLGTGAVTGALTGIASGPAAPLGGALGLAGGYEGANLINKFLLGKKDVPGPLQRAITETALVPTDIMTGGIMGAVIPKVASALSFKALKPQSESAIATAEKRLAAYDELGVSPAGQAGAITGNPTTQKLDASLQAIPISGGTYSRSKDAATGQLEKAFQGAVELTGGKANTVAEGTAAVETGIKSFVKAGQAKSGVLEEEIGKLVGLDRPVDAAPVQQIMDQVSKVWATHPELKPVVMPPIYQKVAAALESGTPLTWEQTRMLRTTIGQMIDNPSLIGDATQGQLKTLYGGLTQSLGNTAQAAGPEAASAWNGYQAYYKMFRNQADVLDDVVKSPQMDNALTRALSGAKNGGRMLGIIKDALPREQWADFQSATLAKLGKPNPGSENALENAFNANTFVTRWNQMSAESRDIVFGSDSALRAQLDRLATVSNAIRGQMGQANTSRTAQTYLWARLLSGNLGTGAGLAVAGQQALQGNAATAALAAGGVGIAQGTPYLTAQLMNNATFVRWLVNSARVPTTNTAALATAVNRLTTLRLAEPALQEDAKRLADYLQGKQQQ